MPRNTTPLPSEQWLQAAFCVLSLQGPQALDAAHIARELGADADEFNLHFKSDQALENAMITYWTKISTDDIIARAGGPPGTPQEKIARLIKTVMQERINSANDHLAEVAVRCWAQGNPAVAEAVKAVDERRAAYTKTLLQECGIGETERDLFSTLICSAVIGLETLPEEKAGEREMAFTFLKNLALKQA